MKWDKPYFFVFVDSKETIAILSKNNKFIFIAVFNNNFFVFELYEFKFIFIVILQP